MDDMHKIRVECPNGDSNQVVATLDGQRIRGLTKLEFRAGPRDTDTTVRLEIIADFVADLPAGVEVVKGPAETPEWIAVEAVHTILDLIHMSPVVTNEQCQRIERAVAHLRSYVDRKAARP